MKNRKQDNYFSRHKHKILSGISFVITFVILLFEKTSLWYGGIYLIFDLMLFYTGREKGIYREAQILEYGMHMDGKYKNMPFDRSKIVPYKAPWCVKHADFIQALLSICMCAFTINFIVPITTPVFWLIYLPNALSFLSGMFDGEANVTQIMIEMEKQLDESYDGYKKYCLEKLHIPFDSMIAEELAINIEVKDYISNVINGQQRFNEKSGRKTAYPVIYNIFTEQENTVIIIPDFRGIFVVKEIDEHKIGKIATSLLKKCIKKQKENNNNLPFATEINSIKLLKEEKKILISVSTK